MKKLGKILINPEKVIKNEELVNLRGGYDTPYGNCVRCIVTFWEGWTQESLACDCGTPVMCVQSIRDAMGSGVEAIECHDY